MMIRGRMAFALALLTLGNVTAYLLPSLSAAQDPTRDENVETLLIQGCENTDSHKEAETRLRSMPSLQAIDAVLHSLNAGDAGKRWDTRKFAYEVLAFHHAATTEGGREQLLRGLDDSVKAIQHIACEALGEDVVTEELDQRLQRFESREASENERTNILRGLSGWGSHAESALPLATELLRDASQSDRLRAFAAIAVLNIGGVEKAVEVLSKLDPVGLRESMGPLATFAGETQGTFGTDNREVRAKVRTFIRECMRNPGREIRILAFQGFVVSFTKGEAKLGNDAEGYIINPELREPLETMARNDPDEGLRGAARQLLDRADEELRVEGKARKIP